MGTAAGYAPDEMTRLAVVAGWADSASVDSAKAHFNKVATLDRGYSLVAVDRYDAFRDALLSVSDRADQVRLAEIAGAELVTISGTAPKSWRTPPRTAVVVAYAMPDDATRTRMLLSVNARDLLDVLHGLRQQRQFVVEHIYDY
jgi:hypothetical protein